jgi:subfamily B ATP-binding cassette protein HlyB/CyaB
MEFFRFRSIFYEVVGASFFIQSFGLVTPLFIQVIIDKVLPHHAVRRCRSWRRPSLR